MRLKIAAALAALSCAFVGVPHAEASDGAPVTLHSGYKLWRHNDAVDFGVEVRMWSCWAPGVQPRLYARGSAGWRLWAIGTVSTTLGKCRGGDNRIVYDFTPSLFGKPVRGIAYRLVQVKETCRGCQPSIWTLPVLPPGAAAG